MQEYWNHIKISEIKSISGVGGSFSAEESHGYFNVIMKDESKHTIHFIAKEWGSKFVNDKRTELMRLYNEYNHVSEMYILENQINAIINGEHVTVGCRCEDNCGDYVYLTNLEIENLKKEFKIKDDGWRHLAYIQAFKIVGNKIEKPISQAHVDNLKYMGYDTDKLEYELL